MPGQDSAWLHDAPWLVPTLITVGGVLALWVLLSPIAHVAASLFDRMRLALRTIIERWSQYCHEAHVGRTKALDEDRTTAIASGVIRDLDGTHSTLWQDTINKLIRPLEQFSSQITDSDHKFGTATRTVEEFLATITPLDDNSLPQITAALQELKPREHITARKAWIDFIISTFLLLCIVVVNTAMLSQILRDADIIPTNIRVGTVSLYWVFALLLTFVETGIGIVHGHHSASSEELKKGPSLAALFMTVLAFGIAFVEGYFYSRIGANRTEVFQIPILDRSITPEQLFFGWGFVLVMALFAFGAMSYRSLMSISHTRSIRAIAKQLRALQTDIAKVTGALTQGTAIIKHKVHEAVTAHEALGQVTPEDKQTIQDVASTLRNDLHAWRDSPPPWAVLASGEAAEGHWNRLQARAAFLFWLTIILVAGLGRMFLGPVARRVLDVPSDLLVSYGIALSFPLAGLLLKPTRTHDRPQLKDFYSVNGIIALIVMLGVFTISIQRLSAGDTASAVMTLCCGALLVFCGAELSSGMIFVRAHLLAIAYRLLDIAGLVIQALLWILYGALSAISGLLNFCAAPFRSLFRNRLAPDPA